MEIRFAEAKDVTGILALLRQVGQVHHQGRPDIFRLGAQKYSPSQILAMLDDPEQPIFIAAQGAQVLGYGFCQMQTYEKDPVMTDRTELYLDDLCVDADSGRQILVRDCRKGGGRLLAGDVITLYGEGAGMKDLFATNFQNYNLPCVNTAYVKIVE